MKKSYQSYIPPAFRRVKWEGQVPYKSRQRRLDQMLAMPKPAKPGSEFDQHGPVWSAADVVHGLGFSNRQQQNLERLVATAIEDPWTNELHVRQKLDIIARDEGMEAAQRRAFNQKALTYWRYTHASKSIQIVSTEELSKAEARGGRYHRRVARKDKGYTYYYNSEKYGRRDDAHVSGEEATSSAIKKRVIERVGMAGTEGCVPKDLKDLAKKYGHQKVLKLLGRECKEGGLSYKKGRFYPAKGKEEVQKALVHYIREPQ